VVAVPFPGKCIQSVFIQRNHTITSGLRKMCLTVHYADLPPHKVYVLPSERQSLTDPEAGIE
jgi:hypothetical protein